MSTATPEKAPTIVGDRFFKITDRHGKHIITLDGRSGFEWSARAIGEFTNTIDHSAAELACRESRLGYRNNWRLPTRSELEFIHDVEKHSPAINTEAFDATDARFFWTSSPFAGAPNDKAWAVGYINGEIVVRERYEKHHVRAVRDPQSKSLPPSDRLVKITDRNGEHIITRDTYAGLEWTADHFSGRELYEYTNESNDSNAENACRKLRIGGHDDWRLPEHHEVLELLDFLKAFPSLYREGFGCLVDGLYWTSTPFDDAPNDKAWAAHPMHATTFPARRHERYRVFAVRTATTAKAGA
ncbi:DUF1566 domain-containing protein [Xylella fastidiosa]|uniref:Lcl C-terminal domain-containing protein n=1 Tax=Xylella fastidiosa TaxID=2371 RepID=UPI0003D32CD3|nr:DUF1566 domain-containing protein [Xylella fastidiosa]OJZ72374.1 hypothetical protein B375_0201600 [Xylella fastidiosa 6c]QPB72971.1 DUF1566 domain-containing protein [Xylella fastidiosa]